MSFRKSLFFHIKTLAAGLSDPIQYGSAFSLDSSHYLMAVVSDPESRQLLCDDPNEQGTALVQFVYIVGNQHESASFGLSQDRLELLQDIVKNILGNFTADSETYNVWNNITEGIQPFGQSEGYYYATLFETTFSWNRV